MKNSVKVFLASAMIFMCYQNEMNAQCYVNMHMSMVSQHTTSTHVTTTIRVYASTTVHALEVGNNVCYNTNTCTGSYTKARRDNDYATTLNCYAEQVGCSVRKDGCVVVIGGRGD